MTAFRSARVQVVIVAVLCFVTARFGWFLASQQHGVSPFWPPSGVALALLMLWGRRQWPSVLVGTMAAHVLAGAISPLTLTSAVANTAEAFLGATIVRRGQGFDASLRRLDDLAILLLAIVVGTFVGSTAGAGAICIYGRAPWAEFERLMIMWWMGDGMGALLLTPLILTWSTWKPRIPKPSVWIEAAVMLSALLLAGYFAFSPTRPHEVTHTALEYLPFPLVIWAALRFGPRGASTASLILGGFSLVQYGLASSGTMSTASLLPTGQANTLLLMQTSIAVILLTGLVTASMHVERDDAMRALAQNETRYRTMYNKTPVMLHSIDGEGRIISVSDYWLRMLGYTREEVLGRRPPDFMEPVSSRRSTEIHLPAFIKGADVQDLEYQFMRKDGSVMDVLLNAVAERDPDGQLTRSMTVLMDVTGHKRAEAERQQMALTLQEARQLESLGLLAGGIAHDFSNLLTSIVGNATLVRRALNGQPDTVHLDEIEIAADRATALCRQIQAYAGLGRLQVRAVDMNTLVDGAVAEQLPSIDPRIKIELYLAQPLPTVDADTTQVHQVIVNLLENAVEAIGANAGRVQLTTSLIHADRAYLASSYLSPDVPAGSFVLLDVHDDGPGMHEDTKARVFDPFFTTKFTGRGLGLPAVLGIVRSHLGAVWVMSEEGHGTTVRVLFPASAAFATLEASPRTLASMSTSAASPAAPASAFATPALSAAPMSSGAARARAAAAESGQDAWRGSGVALVVDDEASVRTVMQRMLAAYGLSVVTAEDGEAGVARFRERPQDISIVLLDLTMPGMDGEQVYQRLREIDPAVPIVMMTGFSHQEAVARCAALNVEALLQKPFRIEELQAVVRQAMRPTV
jgi:PAS domain S-box-containing protein